LFLLAVSYADDVHVVFLVNKGHLSMSVALLLHPLGAEAPSYMRRSHRLRRVQLPETLVLTRGIVAKKHVKFHTKRQLPSPLAGRAFSHKYVLKPTTLPHVEFSRIRHHLRLSSLESCRAQIGPNLII
jgi:hypothetical protein